MRRLGEIYRATRHAWCLIPYTMRCWLLFSFACVVTWITVIVADNPLTQEYGLPALIFGIFMLLSSYGFVVTTLKSFFAYREGARKELFKELTGLSSLPTCGGEIAIMHTRILKTLIDLANASFDEFAFQRKYHDDLSAAARFDKLDPLPQEVEDQLAKFWKESERTRIIDQRVREVKARFWRAHTLFRSLGFRLDSRLSDFYTGGREESSVQPSTATPDDCEARAEGSGDHPPFIFYR